MRGFNGLGNWFGANQSRRFAFYYSAPINISYACVFIFRADGFRLYFRLMVLTMPNVTDEPRLCLAWLVRKHET
jgi:hypothetical protein